MAHSTGRLMIDFMLRDNHEDDDERKGEDVCKTDRERERERKG